jgi:pimeloyl-ACP methyl ester carboxylesterase
LCDCEAGRAQPQAVGPVNPLLGKYCFLEVFAKGIVEMKKSIQRVVLGLAALLVISAIGFVIWAETPSRPGADALTALTSDSIVNVIDRGNYIAFEPTGQKSTTAFLFYPGGHVDFRAYSPILRRIAEQGYPVVLVRVNLNLAFFDIEAGAKALEDFPRISTWVTGGHSLGGVASAYFAYNHPEIKGIVFWASYPADDRLKNSGIKMLSIYGTEDGGLDNGAKIEQYKSFEPDDTEFVVITGGNHGQFGDYGPQPGDNPATISPESQWQQTTDATVQFLASFAN